MGHLESLTQTPPRTGSSSAAVDFGDAAIAVESLGKSYGARPVLADVSFAVAPGKVLGLLGSNGAGKTTTVRILATLIKPDDGRAAIVGHDVRAEPAAVRRAIGLAGQHAAVDGFLTAAETLELVGTLRGVDRAERRRQAGELLDRFDLGSRADKQVRTFSGGTRRRLDLAAALVGEPRVLFLDEPTTGLDARSRHALWAAVRERVAAGATVLLTTQYLEEADALADELIVLDGGRVVASGRSSELKARAGLLTLVLSVDAGDVGRAVAACVKSAVAAGDGTTREVTVPLQRSAEAFDVIARLAAAKIAVSAVRLEEPTLDSAFLALTAAPATEAQTR